MTLSGMETLLMPVFMFLLMLGMGATLSADILRYRDSTAGIVGRVIAETILNMATPVCLLELVTQADH